jgi:hypothetical protein
VIASIPLSPNLPPDRLNWLGTKNGNFSVKSAYHLGLEIIERGKGQTSQVEKGTDVWRYLWNLQVPNPIKIFLWRAYNDILPTRKNLLRRRVIEDGKCPWCNLEEETTAHAIWYCPAAKDVWNVGHSIFQKCAFVGFSFMEIFQLCLNWFNRDKMDYFAAIARRIRLRRNELIFEGVVVLLNIQTSLMQVLLLWWMISKDASKVLKRQINLTRLMFGSLLAGRHHRKALSK